MLVSDQDSGFGDVLAAWPLALLAVVWNFMNGVVIDLNFWNIIASLIVAVVSAVFMGIRAYAAWKKDKREQKQFDLQYPGMVEAAAKAVDAGEVSVADDGVLGFTAGKNEISDPRKRIRRAGDRGRKFWGDL